MRHKKENEVNMPLSGFKILNNKSLKLFIFMLSLFLLLSGCAKSPILSITPVSTPGGTSQLLSENDTYTPGQSTAVSTIFVQATDGTDDGVKRLISSMQSRGLDFYKRATSPNGLIASTDVVLLEINCQWAERGGTNTDLIRSVIQAILDHPDGFRGEIIVADNGQAQYGSNGRGGSLSWANANAVNRQQSAMHVIRSFQERGYKVTGVLWDDFTRVRVQEFNSNDNRDGFVVEDTRRSTGFEISYPKFTTEYGTMVSFKEGIWSAGSYDSEKLKIINMPVLKSHGLYYVTGAVKAYMGTVSDRLTNGRSHNSVGRGGMGTQMAGTRMPVLNLMDMIWIGAEQGPGISYAAAIQINKIAASVDPIALDYWAAKYILMPEAAKLPGGRAASKNPDGTQPGTFGYWLRLSMNELHQAGIWATMTESEIMVIGM
ncbi:MAG: DUF362 domain-containing protein [Treponema sp.]|jgi:hypothetical protein|nr:DUF362 domain-containing protein [Treponema sp.]